MPTTPSVTALKYCKGDELLSSPTPSASAPDTTVVPPAAAAAAAAECVRLAGGYISGVSDVLDCSRSFLAILACLELFLFEELSLWTRR